MSKTNFLLTVLGALLIGIPAGVLIGDVRRAPEREAARTEGRMLGVCGALSDVVLVHPDVGHDLQVSDTLRYCASMSGAQ